MKFARKLTTTATPDLIPMIDVVFQLVVFFLMSSTFVVSPGIALQLPGSSTTEPVVTDSISLYLYEDGRLFLGETEITLTQLPQILLDSGVPTTAPISLLAEGNAPYQRIIDILDSLRSQGFLQVALRAEVRD